MGLEADSQLEKNVAVVKAGILSTLSSSQEPEKWRICDIPFFAILAETTRQGVQFYPERNTDYGALNTT